MGSEMWRRERECKLEKNKKSLSNDFFFQAEDGIRYAQESRGLGDVYKRQIQETLRSFVTVDWADNPCMRVTDLTRENLRRVLTCLLYTSDAADDLLCVDLGGRRIIKKKNNFRYLFELL